MFHKQVPVPGDKGVVAIAPSDKDVYMRPNTNYKVSDNMAVELGGNIFFGDYPNTFFGQFRDNTNIYAGLRYSF